MELHQKDIKYGSEVCLIHNSFGIGQSLSCGIVSDLIEQNWVHIRGRLYSNRRFVNPGVNKIKNED